MTHKEQVKILDDEIKSNVNQYKVDRLNAEISAFSSGDLNKYEFLTRKDLKYKPNALDKAIVMIIMMMIIMMIIMMMIIMMIIMMI